MSSRSSVAFFLAALTVSTTALARSGAAQGGAGATCLAQAKLQASDGGDGELFGFSVASHGDLAVVGAPEDGDRGLLAGAAYVFRRAGRGWSETQKLVSSDGSSFDEFGLAVAVWDGAILVGAYGEDGPSGTYTGAVYVFSEVGGVWIETQKLTATMPLFRFGVGLALREDVALVQAGQGSQSNQRGAVVVFERTAGVWAEGQTLFGSDGHVGDEFGEALALGEELAAIGAPGHDALGNMAGAAYVFERTGGIWSETQRLAGEGTATRDRFGRAVALDGDTLLVGASGDDDPLSGTPDVGSVHVFRDTGGSWSEESQMRPIAGLSFDGFGVSLALAGDLALVGATGDDGNGAVHVFRREGAAWSFLERWKGDEGSLDFFGHALALHAGQALVAAPFEDRHAEVDDNSGSVYTLEAALAAALHRNAGANPDSLDASPARIGETWTFTVDLSTTGHTYALVVLTSAPIAATLSGGQVLLAGGDLVLSSPLLAIPIWSVEIPVDCGLVGLPLTAQALQGVPPPFALSNALDVTVGY